MAAFSLDMSVYTPICCLVQCDRLRIRFSGRVGMSSLDLAPPQPSMAAPAVAVAEKAKYDPRTRALIEGPIAATLIRLAAPNVLVMLAQTSVGLVETYFIGKLGTDPLAGVALVFPLLMLMQMMSAGAMGGGISSAIARALGAGRRADADALAVHAQADIICISMRSG